MNITPDPQLLRPCCPVRQLESYKQVFPHGYHDRCGKTQNKNYDIALALVGSGLCISRSPSEIPYSLNSAPSFGLILGVLSQSGALNFGSGTVSENRLSDEFG